MFKPKTFIELCQAMQTGATVQIDKTEGVILAIQKEDGSGRNWNVTLIVNKLELSDYDVELDTPQNKTVFFRE